jgi:hypothetical protein
VDSDFASDIDTRKSVTGYLMVLNGGPVSWKASRQWGLTLSSSEAEFVDASQRQEVVSPKRQGTSSPHPARRELGAEHAQS